MQDLNWRRALPGAWALVVIFSSFFFWGGAQHIKAQAVHEKPEPSPKIFALGKALYEKQCQVCHGAKGAGDGKAAYLLYPKPRDFTRNEFRLISTNEMKAADRDLFQSISRGMPGSAMPSWEHLSASERWGLVYYVRFLTEVKRYLESGEVTEAPLSEGPPWDILKKIVQEGIDPSARVKVSSEPAVTEEGISRGRELFVKACAACHGLQGKGDGRQIMKDTLGDPLKPRDLTRGIFKGASTSEELYYRIAAGLPGTPMPSYQSAFTEEQIWDLIHYVQTLPEPGAEEKSRLKQLKIRAKKAAGVLDFHPAAEIWPQADPVSVTLTPLWWRDECNLALDVQALHNGELLAIRLSWADPVQNDSTVRPQSFSDGAAIQFSAEQDPPFFAMGSADGQVVLWHWKASWQSEKTEWPDIETEYPNTGTDWYESQMNYELGEAFESKSSKTRLHDAQYLTGWGAGNSLSDPNRLSSAEEAHAKGLGTLTTAQIEIDTVEADGVWNNGRWNVVFTRALRPQEKGRLEFKAGKSVNIAFAVWDGEHKDRNGQKAVSIWQELELER